MQPFVYNAHPARVIFGSGTLSQLPAEVERLGLERALVLATPQQEADAQQLAILPRSARGRRLCQCPNHAHTSLRNRRRYANGG